MDIANKVGDRQSPCLTQEPTGNQSIIFPSTFTQLSGFWYIALMLLKILPVIPIWLNLYTKKSWLTQLNAFWKSIHTLIYTKICTGTKTAWQKDCFVWSKPPYPIFANTDESLIFDRNENSGKLSGGGLICYTCSVYNFELVEGSKLCTPDIESFWVKLQLNDAKPTYVKLFYRPPDGSVPDFLKCIEEQLSLYVTYPLFDVLMMGDANIDVSKRSTNHNLLKQFLANHNLSQLINRPTRTTDTSSTIIDYFYSNNPELI